MTSVSLKIMIAPTHILVLIASMEFPSGSNSQVRPKKVALMNKELLEPIMRAHGDKNKDLAAAIGMSVPNFSTIWNGRGEFAEISERRLSIP